MIDIFFSSSSMNSLMKSPPVKCSLSFVPLVFILNLQWLPKGLQLIWKLNRHVKHVYVFERTERWTENKVSSYHRPRERLSHLTRAGAGGRGQAAFGKFFLDISKSSLPWMCPGDSSFTIEESRDFVEKLIERLDERNSVSTGPPLCCNLKFVS